MTLRPLLASIALAIAASSASLAQEVMKHQLDISRQPLGSALAELARQARIQVIYSADLVEGLSAPEIKGAMTSEQALQQMLPGSGLAFEYLDENTVTLMKEGSGKRTAGAPVSSANGNKDADPVRMVLAEDSSAEAVSSGDKIAQDKQDASGYSGSPKIEEIVVTAQKREQRLIDVPITVSTVSGEDLARRDIKDAVDLSFAVPSLGAFQVSPGQNLLQIRGISTFRGGASLIGMYLDEIPLTAGLRLADGSGLDAQTFDLARVEVLKGPQGTLFGEGAAGGVIRYITNDPKLDDIEGRLTASYFNTEDGAGSEEIGGVLNVPLVSDVLGLRVAGTYRNNGGWIDNITTGEEDYNESELADVRAKLLYMPTENFTVSALIDIHRLDAQSTNIVNQRPFDRSEFRQAFDDPAAATNLYNNFDIYNLTASYDFGFATLLSSTSHFDVDIKNNSWTTQLVEEVIEILGPGAAANQSVTSQELRLTSNGTDAFKWLIGANYKKSDNEHDPANPFRFLVYGPSGFYVEGPGGGSSEASSRISTAFADTSYTFFDRLELGGGARYYSETQDGTSFQDGVQIGSTSADYHKTTYRVFAKYRLTSNVNLYANTATGFRSGGVNSAQAVARGAPAVADPENSVFYEIGLKGTGFNGKLGFELAAFKGKFKDQIQNILKLIDNQFLFYQDNAGEADIDGFEWQLNVMPLSRLSLGVGGAVLDTEYTKTSPQAPVVAGDPLDFVPEYDLVVTADYGYNWSANVPGYINVSYSRKGEMQNTNRGCCALIVDQSEPLEFLQASVGAEWNGFEFTLFGRNLLDERGRLNPQYTGMWPQARPRSIGISVGKSF